MVGLISENQSAIDRKKKSGKKNQMIILIDAEEAFDKF